MLRQYAAIGLIVAFACSCSEKQIQSPYFDTKAYFEQQAATLSLTHARLDKELAFAGKHQHLVIDSVNWHEELTPFLEIDFHKPSYNGRYKTDTLGQAYGYRSIIYQCTDPKLDLQKLIVTYTNTDAIASILVEYREKNSLYSAVKTQVYYPGRGYTISGKQEVTLGNSIEYLTKATLITP